MVKKLNPSPINDGFAKHVADNKHQSSSPQSVRQNSINSILELCETLSRKHGVHSVIRMDAAGFKYTGVGDTARCPDCGLEISGWTTDMHPVKIHLERRPDCTFVRSLRSSNIAAASSSSSSSIQTNLARTTSQLNEQEKPSKRRNTGTTNETGPSNMLVEIKPFKDVRVRTFSHWPHRTSPSKAQMIEAGFFNCNVGDRVICLYCNLICQQWKPHTDDPCEVHKTLRPWCPFVRAMLVRRDATSILNVNENSNDNSSPAAAVSDQFCSNEIVLTEAANVAYIEIPKRHASFANWPDEPLPPVDDLVRAGFYYTGTKTIVTCFYCNGSLQNWGPNDNPTIEHARWFPHCAYAQQLCEKELYRKIQDAKRSAQECKSANKSINSLTSNRPNLQRFDESTLSRLVAARLDLPISQRLLNQNFKLSIIKRCWEDQLRLKQDDFATHSDLFVACIILQKQIQHIDGKKENIIIPSEQMRKKYETELALAQQRAATFTENEMTTIQRQQSLRDWPHLSPSRRDMANAGWARDPTRLGDHTICLHCKVRHHDWHAGDDPLLIHRQLSPLCRFVLSPHPISASSIPIYTIQERFSSETVAINLAQLLSDAIRRTNAFYGIPPRRAQTFHCFPGGPPANTDALINSGFFYCGKDGSTDIQCYHCNGTATDLHQQPANQINTLHRQRFPGCHLAKLLPGDDQVFPRRTTENCLWCFKEKRLFAAAPCEHLVVCRECARLIRICPICLAPVHVFFNIYLEWGTR